MPIERRRFAFTLLTPEKTAFCGEAVAIKAIALDGALTVLANHAPLVTVLKPGVVAIQTDNGSHRFVVTGGILRVARERTTLVAATAERPEEIDVGRAEAAKERALKRLGQESGSGHARARAALARAMARLEAGRPDTER